MQGRNIKRGLSIAGVLIGATVCSEALAFDAVVRPWRSTPERFLTTKPASEDARSAAIAVQGLRVMSVRANGTPAVLWSEVQGASRPDSAEAAERRALEVGTSLAADFGISGEELFVAASTPLFFPAIEGGAQSFITVSLGQAHRGAVVQGGYLFFVFRDGNLTSIRNDLVIHQLDELVNAIDGKIATKIALDAAREFAPSSTLVAEAALNIWAPSDEAEDVRWVQAVRTRSLSPRTELTFQIDAVTGEILAADDSVRFANGDGRVRILAEPINGSGMTVPFVAKGLSVGNGRTDGDGEQFQAGPVNVTYDGPFATVSDQTGSPNETFPVSFGGPYQIFDLQPNNLSQADPFVHINRVKEYARTLTPTMQWLDQKLVINVNINDACNAFWDGDTVNFFRAGGGCNNTGRISSIVYHELGHGYHQFLTNNIVGSVGEGTGDFLSALMLDDAIVGRGFATNGSGIRRIDEDRVFPNDVQNQVHEDGLIWASALWDLRSALEQKHGAWAGKKIAARNFVLALTQGPGLTTAYPAIIAADDDDNNLANGTPNSCEINAAFNLHGLITGGQINHTAAAVRSYPNIAHVAPGRFLRDTNGVRIEATVENRSPSCGTFDPSQLKVKVAPGLAGGTFTDVGMVVSGAVSSAVLANINEGDTFRYYFEIIADGVTYSSGNAASPHLGYVQKTGEAVISRENFEADFGTWKHGSIGVDRIDDWEIGAPLGLAFDPFAAREGTKVAGTDLGAGGYPSGTDGVSKRATYLESAPIPTTGMENIRLDLWHHFAINGTLRIKVDGVEAWNYTGNGTEWSGGWKYLSINLPASARDNAAGVVVRFEAESTAANVLGGWSLDDLSISGIAIPPPPPPPEEPKEPPMEEPMTPPVTQPTDPGMQNPQQPIGGEEEPAEQRGPSAYSGTISASCACVAPIAKGEGFAGAALILVGLALTLSRRRR